MTPTATAIPTAAEPTTSTDIPAIFQAAAAAWIAGMFFLAYITPLRYEVILQEDGFVEWLTVTLFAAAAWFRFRDAWPRRRIFDLLVAAFCIFVAGEEFSWGQRLLGFTPPAVFLEHNTQQEFTLHNFASFFGKPKGVLILALLGYGVVLPVAARWPWANRAGATPPPRAAIAWFIAAAGLLIWYPVDFTGEWVEALAAALFLVSARPARSRLAVSSAIAVGAAGLLALVSSSRVSVDADAVACATREATALASDLAERAATAKLYERSGSVHKRLWTAVQDRYVDTEGLEQFARVACGQAPDHLIDPWGMAYWLRYSGARREITVYSMGPNRRRDADDIRAAARLP